MLDTLITFFENLGVVKVPEQLEYLSDIPALLFAVWETLYAPLAATLFAYLIGLPLGVLLVTGEQEGIRVSCASGAGREALEAAVEKLFLRDSGERDSLAAINTRHRFALQQAQEALAAAREGLLAGVSPEFVDVDLRAALDSLGSITGRIDTEDILTRVFATFCLGK